GSDGWLNTPRLYHEASGTSGLTAAMNASINISLPAGWIPEFARDGQYCFIIEPAKGVMHDEERDRIENNNLLNLLEKKVLPTYYNEPKKWTSMIKASIEDVLNEFDSNRLAKEYYEDLYR